MSLGGLAGFALVFVLCTWTLSAAGGLALVGSRARLMRLGPLAERRAAVIAAITPVALASIVVAALVLRSRLGVDHCPTHGHHAHLCLAHGAQWLERAWVLAALALGGAVMIGRCARLLSSFLRGARGVRELHALSRAADGVRIVESARAFCFVADRGRPAIYVSSRAWSSLCEAERAALVAHEAAHIHQGDLRTRAAIEAFLVLAAPGIAPRIRDTWLRASERLCDARAARATGRPESVASALVSLCRLQVGRPAAGLGFTPRVDELAGRVRAVLDGGPLGERAAAILRRAAAVACAMLVAAAAVAADPLHHALETLLG